MAQLTDENSDLRKAVFSSQTKASAFETKGLDSGTKSFALQAERLASQTMRFSSKEKSFSSEEWFVSAEEKRFFSEEQCSAALLLWWSSPGRNGVSEECLIGY